MQQHISVNNRNITLYEFKEDSNGTNLKLQDDYKVKDKKKKKKEKKVSKNESVQNKTNTNIPAFLLSDNTAVEEEQPELEDEKPVIVNWDQFKKEELASLETDSKRRKIRHDSDNEDSDLDDLPRHSNSTSANNHEASTTQEDQIVYRDPTSGKRISKEEYEIKKKNAKSPYEKIYQNELEWASGLVQKKQSQQSLSKNLNNEQWNETMNETLEEQQKREWKEEDPMASILLDKADTTSSHATTTKYSPNRYGIRAGKRWDGVDRSNGFESKLVLMKKERQSAEENYYKYSTEDM